MSVISTEAPFAASRVATALPMPEAPPVTIADRFATSYVAMVGAFLRSSGLSLSTVGPRLGQRLGSGPFCIGRAG
jgi:hypothetical protein